MFGEGIYSVKAPFKIILVTCLSSRNLRLGQELSFITVDPTAFSGQLYSLEKAREQFVPSNLWQLDCYKELIQRKVWRARCMTTQMWGCNGAIWVEYKTKIGKKRGMNFNEAVSFRYWMIFLESKEKQNLSRTRFNAFKDQQVEFQ